MRDFIYVALLFHFIDFSARLKAANAGGDVVREARVGELLEKLFSELRRSMTFRQKKIGKITQFSC